MLEINPLAPWIVNTLLMLFSVLIGAIAGGCFILNRRRILSLERRVEALEKK